MAIWDDGTGKIWIVSGGNPFDATQNTLEGCCCCAPCCEDPWVICVEVTDGSITAKALVSIDTTLSGCCCTGTGTGALCKTDGTSIGTVQVELLVTHDGTFARFTVTSATLATCAAGCVSAWVEGVLTGTAPNNCTITFSLTIARNGTTALTISATDSYTNCNGCDCNNCAACRGGSITLVVSGITGGFCQDGLNGIYVLAYSPTCNWSGWIPGKPACPASIATVICSSGKWSLWVRAAGSVPAYDASAYPILLNCTGTHPTGAGVFNSWSGCANGAFTMT